MRKEIIISDLCSAVQEKDRLAEISTADNWEVVSYETAAVSGKLLIASEQTMPAPVTITPELTGWYRRIPIQSCTSEADRRRVQPLCECK